MSAVAGRLTWMQFGRWPSGNDIDLVLVDDTGETYAALETVLDSRKVRHPADGADLELVSFASGDLPTPAALIDQAVSYGRRHGLPLDVFLSPRPGDFSVAAWVEPPYDRWLIGWRPTLNKRFFEPYRPLAPADRAV